MSDYIRNFLFVGLESKLNLILSTLSDNTLLKINEILRYDLNYIVNNEEDFILDYNLNIFNLILCISLVESHLSENKFKADLSIYIKVKNILEDFEWLDIKSSIEA